MQNNYAVIMAGGLGTRFWPSSTAQKPKQFLDVLGVGKSLLRITFDRILPLLDIQNIIILTNKDYKNLVKSELPELPENNILCEPSRNNTAPCVAYAALHINKINPQACMAVLASDHVIKKEVEFRDILNFTFDYCKKNDVILTLGIKPSRPDTGYGYLELEQYDDKVLKVKEFREKPDLTTASHYLSSGNYVWNSGMFIFNVRTILAAFAQYSPAILNLLNARPEIFNTSQEQNYIDQVYPQTENISIDYAIMEKADNIFNVSADIGWSDLGTWASLYDYTVKEDDGNFVQAGNTILIDVQDCLIKVNNKDIILKGLKDYIIVDEDNALLIYPKNEEQEIKSALNLLNQKK